MTTLLFFIGCGLLIAGVALVNTAAAFIVAGVIVAGFAVFVELGPSSQGEGGA